MPSLFIPLALAALALVPQEVPATQDDELAAQLYRQQSALAEWRLHATVDGDAADLVAALVELEQAAGQLALGAPRNTEVIAHLAEVNAAHLRHLVERGLLAAAVEQYGDLCDLAGLEAEYPGRALSEAARLALSLDGMDAIQARIPLAVQEAAAEPGVRTSEEVVIANAVRQAVQQGKAGTVRDLGVRAVPTLREMALLMGPTPAKGAAEAALLYVAGIDRPTALDLALEIARRPSFLVRKRIVETLVEEQVLQQESVWTPTEPGTWALARPEWLELFELLTSEPGVAPADLEGLLGQCVFRGFVPATIERLAVEVGDRALPRSAAPAPATSALAARLIDDPRDEVRLWAARTLYQTPTAAAITTVAALATDPSVDVRRLVVNALQKRQANVRVSHSWESEGFRQIEIAPERNAATRAALSALIRDESKQIANLGVNQLVSLHSSGVTVLDVEELQQLAGSVADEQLRARIFGVALEAGDETQDAATIARVLADPAPRVRAMAFYWPTNGSYARDDATLYWATIERTRELEAFSSERALSTAMSVHGEDVSWQHATLDWLSQNGSDADWVYAVFGNQPRGIITGWARALGDRARVELLRGLVPRMAEDAFNLDLWERQSDASPWLAATLDDSAPPLVRVLAAWPAITPETVSPALVPAIVEALVAVSRSGKIEPGRLDTPAFKLEAELTRAGLAPFELVIALLEAGDLQDDFRSYLELRGVSEASPERQRALARAVVRRYPPATWPTLPSPRLVGQVVTTAHHLPLEEQLVMLDAATRVPRGAVRRQAFRAVAESRDPRLLEVLRRHVRSGERDGLEEVAQAAAGFLSDEAGEVVLEAAAATSDPESRAAILASLDQITAYQDARARWQRRSDAAARRTEAVDALVGLADDTTQPVEVRAEALRGLALLEAVEELPRLVRALAAPEAPIRDAARAALARLNAPAGDGEAGDGK